MVMSVPLPSDPISPTYTLAPLAHRTGSSADSRTPRPLSLPDLASARTWRPLSPSDLVSAPPDLASASGLPPRILLRLFDPSTPDHRVRRGVLHRPARVYLHAPSTRCHCLRTHRIRLAQDQGICGSLDLSTSSRVDWLPTCSAVHQGDKPSSIPPVQARS